MISTASLATFTEIPLVSADSGFSLFPFFSFLFPKILQKISEQNFFQILAKFCPKIHTWADVSAKLLLFSKFLPEFRFHVYGNSEVFPEIFNLIVVAN